MLRQQERSCLQQEGPEVVHNDCLDRYEYLWFASETGSFCVKGLLSFRCLATMKSNSLRQPNWYKSLVAVPCTEFVICAYEPDSPSQIRHAHRGNSAHETVFLTPSTVRRDTTRCDAFLVWAAAAAAPPLGQGAAARSTHNSSFALVVSLLHQLLWLLYRLLTALSFLNHDLLLCRDTGLWF